MKILELGKYRRARVWIGELPDAAYPSVKTLAHSVSATTEPHGKRKMAAVELLVVTGPRSLYGMLGGHFTVGPTGRLNVDVRISTANERLFADNLAGTLDEVRVGLPAEYAQAVLAGVDLAKGELNALTAGKLSINCAAHGAIGSCEAVFKHLAAILVKLFNSGSVEISDEELIKLFPPTFS